MKIDPHLKITQKQIISYLDFVKDEEGRIPLETESDSSRSDESVLHSIARSQEEKGCADVKKLTSGKVKRVTISNLLQDRLIQEGDSWRFEYKGEVTWGRVTGNGEVEVNGETYSNPSRAGYIIKKEKPCGGWGRWQYRDSSGEWHKIKNLREQYRERHGILAEQRKKAA